MPISSTDIAGIVRTVRRQADLLRYARYMLIYNFSIFAWIVGGWVYAAGVHGDLSNLADPESYKWPLLVVGSVALAYLCLAMRLRWLYALLFLATIGAYLTTKEDKLILLTAIALPFLMIYDPTYLPLAPLAVRLVAMVAAFVYVMSCFVLFSGTWLWTAGRTPAAAYGSRPSVLSTFAPGHILETRLPGLRLQRTSWLERVLFAIAALLFVAATMAIFYQARAVQNEYGAFLAGLDTGCASGGLTPETIVAVVACIAERYTWIGTAVVVLIPLAVLGTALVLANVCRTLARRRFLTRLSDRAVTPDGATLFLRAFRDDQVTIRQASRNLFSLVFDLGRTPATLDELMLEKLDGRGDLIAIGNPQDRRGLARQSPWGARRLYVDDEAWQDTVRQLAASADRIVLCVDASEGVRWEIRHLLDGSNAPKSLFVFNPALDTPTRTRLLIDDFGLTASELATIDVAHILAAQVPTRGDVHLLLCARPERDAFIVAARLAFAHP